MWNLSRVSRKPRYSNPTEEHGSISLMSIRSQPGASSEPPPETGRSDCDLLRISPSLSQRDRHGCQVIVSFYSSGTYSQTRLETTGLNTICPFSASGPGQSRRLAESRSLCSPAPLRQACPAELDTRLQAALTVSVGSQFQHLQPSEAAGLWQKSTWIFQKCFESLQ